MLFAPPNKIIIIENIPTYPEIVQNRVGHCLAVVEELEPRFLRVPGITEFFFNQGLSNRRRKKLVGITYYQ